MFIILAATGLAFASSPLFAQEQPETSAIDFSRDVLPILSNKCFACHGPDVKKENDLRLDSYAGATRDLGGYRAVDPKDPAKSEILARIYDHQDPMPPKDAEKQLTGGERELLARWIRQGGRFAEHWAFVPPQKPNSPRAGPEDVNAIDAFVLARLQERKAGFAPEAGRAVHARRAALALTGLPPEPDQLSRYLADESDGAYDRLVDELLGSPRFGEHQARYWLDAVRYGDTHGLHLDNRRGIYPYRDWVVRAFNENLPLDDFIVWQLAGDLLPNPSLEQRLATGFVRMNPTTSEGGVLPEEFQAKNNFDRTETLGTVLLGMTLTCARCHNHKYDPISQKEYYRLLAFFNSTSENSLDGNAYRYEPVLEVPENPAAWEEWSALLNERDRLLEQVAFESDDERSTLIAYAQARPEFTAEDWRVSPAVGLNDPAPPESDWQTVKDLPGTRKTKLPAGSQAVWLSFQVEAKEDQRLWLKFSGGSESKVFIDQKPIDAGVNPSTEQRNIEIPLTLPKGVHRVRVKMAGTVRETAMEAGLSDPWKTLAEAKSWEACGKEIRLRLLSEPHGPLARMQLQKPAARLSKRFAELPTAATLVAKELSEPRETRVLMRGEYNLPIGDPLEPGILKVMGGIPSDAPPNRLGLARWLTSRDHPLVSRVIVNRLWQRVFGDGIVRTPEDFGLQGRQPTHPRLLDWLAVELQDSGWNLKHMLRLMATSRAFRQDSAHRRDLEDPENRLWSRGPSYRLDAEVLRDIGLWAGGILDPHMGGEGVKPYQPEGLWLAMAHPASNTKLYVPDPARLVYRRSLYVYWKRTSPHPMMTLFDAPSRESSCVRRSRTNTPLQSLGLLNETQRLEMARALGERLLRERRDDRERLDLLFTLLTCRAPNERERAACLELLSNMRSRYEQSEQDALALLNAGNLPRDRELEPSEHAAWSQLALTVLASDAAILLY